MTVRQTLLRPLQGRVLVVLMMIITSWIATEFIAFILHYSSSLGSPLCDTRKTYLYDIAAMMLIFCLIAAFFFFNYPLRSNKRFITLSIMTVMSIVVAILPVYNPIDFFIWFFKFNHLTSAWIWYVGISLIGSGAALSSLFYVHFIRHSPKALSTLHGSAQFADSGEIKQTGLLDTTSPYALYVGAWQESVKSPIHYLRYTGESNAGVFAPPRSGKGAGIIILNLLSFLGNAVVLDLKLENFHYTAGFRKSLGQRILKLDYTCTDESSACLNPLLEVRKGIYEVRDVQNMVDIIADPDGKGRSDHWTDTANDLLVSIVLHVLYVEEDKSLTGVRNFVSNVHLNEEELFKYMKNTIHDPEGIYKWIDPHTGHITRTHPIVAAGASDMLNRTEAERTGITSTLKRFLKLYRDPIIAKNSRTSDFKLCDLLDTNQKITLYINMPPSDKHRLRPLIRLVLNQMLSRLTETWVPPEQRDQHRVPLLLIMDEFPQLGRLQFFESALAYTAGYGLRTLLICQDLSQVYSEYGHHQSITSSCDLLTIYAPNKLETAQYFSNMLGSQTITRKQTNYSGHRSSPTLSHINTSEQDFKRALLTPDELMRIPFDQSIIFKTGHRPIKGLKVMYWQDLVFYARSKLTPPLVSDKSTITHDWNHVLTKQFDETTEIEEGILDTEVGNSEDEYDLL
jgi:type IV secretion system protein VirD4